MSSRQGFPGIGLRTPSRCFGPTIDSITVNTITVSGTLVTNDLTVTGTVSAGTVIETIIIQANFFEEFTAGAGVTINSPMYFVRTGVQYRHTVYDVSGSTATGFVNVTGSSTTYDSALRYTNTASGAFIFEGNSGLPYLTLYNDAGVGKALVDRIAPNATTNVNISSIVVGPNTTNTPGGIRYNANNIEVCNNLGVWGPVGNPGTTYTGSSNIDVTGNVISLVNTPTISGILTASGGISTTTMTTSGNVTIGGTSTHTGVANFNSQVNVNAQLWVTEEVFASNFATSNSVSCALLSMAPAGVPVYIYADRTVMTNGQEMRQEWGKDQSTNNQGILKYVHVTDSSINNRVSLGMRGNENILNVTGNGRIGINVTAPTAELDVSGQIRSTSMMTTTANITNGTITTATIPTANITTATITTSNMTTARMATCLDSVDFTNSSTSPTNTIYNFYNATVGNVTGGMQIAPWVDGRCLITLIGDANHDIRSRIDSTANNTFIQVTNDGVNYRYMNVSQTMSPVPVLGSFASDVSGRMKYYTGAAWKYLTPMDSATLRAEMNGITAGAATFNMVWSNDVAMNMCPNGTTTPTLSIQSTTIFSQITNATSAFFLSTIIEGVAKNVITTSTTAGLVLDYVSIGSNFTAAAPIGAIVYDSTDDALQLKRLVGWQRIGTSIGYLQVQLVTGNTAGDGITINTIDGPFGVITGATTPGFQIDLAITAITGTYRGVCNICRYPSTPRFFSLFNDPASSTSTNMVFIPGAGSDIFSMIGANANVIVEFYVNLMSY